MPKFIYSGSIWFLSNWKIRNLGHKYLNWTEVWTEVEIWNSKMRHPNFGLIFYIKTQRLSHFSRFIPFYRNETSKSKKQKNRLQKQSNVSILNREFSFCWVFLLILGFNKFLPNGIRPADNNFVTPSQEGVAKLLSPRFFSVFMRVSGLFKVDFSKSPHRGCPTPKRAKTAKNRLLVTAQEGGFFIF